MSEIARPWDSGLQIERTRLAWQRTALSGLAVSLAIARLVAIYSWPLGVAVGLVAVVATAGVAVASTHRYRKGNTALPYGAALPDARAFLALSVLVLATGFGALCYLIAAP